MENCVRYLDGSFEKYGSHLVSCWPSTTINLLLLYSLNSWLKSKKKTEGNDIWLSQIDLSPQNGGHHLPLILHTLIYFDELYLQNMENGITGLCETWNSEYVFLRYNLEHICNYLKKCLIVANKKYFRGQSAFLVHLAILHIDSLGLGKFWFDSAIAADQTAELGWYFLTKFQLSCFSLKEKKLRYFYF